MRSIKSVKFVINTLKPLLALAVLLPSVTVMAGELRHQIQIPLEESSVASVSIDSADYSVEPAPLAPPAAQLLPDSVVVVEGMGSAVSLGELNSYRGGSDVSNVILPNGFVRDNTVVNVATGTNSINDNAFTNASGLPVVIQNSGNNVLIQNATIVNVQLK